VKTRIIHTKFWDDDTVSNLSPTAKYLFIYLFTNHRIGLTGAYEITNRVISFETGLTQSDIDKAKKELSELDRCRFHRNWVFVVNAQRHGGYFGEKLMPAVEKEFYKLPLDIRDTLCIPYPYSSDTTINHKEETIKHNTEIEKDLTEGIDLGEIPF